MVFENFLRILHRLLGKPVIHQNTVIQKNKKQNKIWYSFGLEDEQQVKNKRNNCSAW